VTEQVSHSYKRTGDTIILCVEILFFRAKRETTVSGKNGTRNFQNFIRS